MELFRSQSELELKGPELKGSVPFFPALRLAKYFGSSVEFWTGLQADYDVAVARATMSGVLSRIVAHEAAVA